MFKVNKKDTKTKPFDHVIAGWVTTLILNAYVYSFLLESLQEIF